jgi:hypothetical protein
VGKDVGGRIAAYFKELFLKLSEGTDERYRASGIVDLRAKIKIRDVSNAR